MWCPTSAKMSDSWQRLSQMQHLFLQTYCDPPLELPLYTLKCLSIGTPKAINFPFVADGKLMFLSVPIFKHIIMRL